MRKTFSNVCLDGLRTSQIPNPIEGQMTTRRLRGTFLYIYMLYSPYWRGLTALSILSGIGQWEGLVSRRIGREQAPAPFLYALTTI